LLYQVGHEAFEQAAAGGAPGGRPGGFGGFDETIFGDSFGGMDEVTFFSLSRFLLLRSFYSDLGLNYCPLLLARLFSSLFSLSMFSIINL